jgi:hypothetical protein
MTQNVLEFLRVGLYCRITGGFSAKRNPNALQDELIRHVNEDGKMSTFEALAVETGSFRRLP